MAADTGNAAPFCEARPARRAFDAWCARLEDLGVVLGAADLFVIGLVASREVRLADLQLAVKRERFMDTKLKLIEAERKASALFQSGLDLLERTFGARAAAAAAAPRALALAVGAGRVLPMRPKLASLAGVRKAAPNKGAEAVKARILAAVARARAPLTKQELRLQVQADDGTFLRVLGELVKAGQVARSGRGVRSQPHRYGPRA
jgi:hypothetical protein